MMVLRYTPEARMDLRSLREYIAQELKNPMAAKKITSEILEQCAMLKEFPRMGGSLSGKTGRDSDLYYLVCGEQIAFYRIGENTVSIIRILNGRTNYIQVLFGAGAEQ